MKKSLIIGLSTLALTGTVLLASNIYAATSTEATSVIGSLRHIHQNSESFLTTLSGEVSPAAYNATKILFNLEKTKMEALRSTTMKGDQAKIKAEFDTMKTKVDALIIAYPELKGKIPSPGNGDKMGGHRGQIDAVLATLPSTAQDQLKTIRDSYKAKIDILRTAEKSEIDSILTAYPEAKTKLDALESSREPSMGMMKRHGRRGADFSHESADTMIGMSPISQ